MTEGFLLGIIVTASLTAAAYLIKILRQKRDTLFQAYSKALFIEVQNLVGFLFVERPNEAGAMIYVVRLVAFLLILGAIVRKNQKGA